MGLGDMVDKAKDWAGKNPDKADGFVDKGADYAKGKFGHDGQVDQASEKAKGFLHGDQGEEQPQGEQPPPPPQ